MTTRVVNNIYFVDFVFDCLAETSKRCTTVHSDMKTCHVRSLASSQPTWDRKHTHTHQRQRDVVLPWQCALWGAPGTVVVHEAEVVISVTAPPTWQGSRWSYRELVQREINCNLLTIFLTCSAITAIGTRKHRWWNAISISMPVCLYCVLLHASV